jgi:hypothetical protein
VKCLHQLQQSQSRSVKSWRGKLVSLCGVGVIAVLLTVSGCATYDRVMIWTTETINPSFVSPRIDE